MTGREHAQQAELLLTQAALNQNSLHGQTLPTQDMASTLHLIDQQIAMAHVHALLAPYAERVEGR